MQATWEDGELVSEGLREWVIKKTGWIGAWRDGSLGMDAQTDRIDEWINGHIRGRVYG